MKMVSYVESLTTRMLPILTPPIPTKLLDKSQYAGTWKDGEFADGDWKFKDGSCYKGAFKHGKPAPGDGVFNFPNGNEQKGRYTSAAPIPDTYSMKCRSAVRLI